MYILIENSDNCLKTSGVLQQFYRDVSSLGNNGAITDFIAANSTTESLNFKEKLRRQTGNNGIKMLK